MPYTYSDAEYMDMSICYTVSGYSLPAARDMYRQIHRFGSIPSSRTILRAVQRLKEHNQFRVPNINAGRPRQKVSVEERVIKFFEKHPSASFTDAAKQLGISSKYARKILEEDGKHPYHSMREQELLTPDYPSRLQFCRWLLEEPRHILWTDETIFTRTGLFNCFTHLWAAENLPAVKVDQYQHQFSLNVWAGLYKNVVFGPIFLPIANGETYLEVLQEVQDILEDTVPVQHYVNLYYQHDGSLAHFYKEVREYLDTEFPNRWIGREGPVPWPSFSQDLTPMNFFLWERVKSMVYGSDANEIENVDILRERIVSAFNTLKADDSALVNVQAQLIQHANQCIHQEGKMPDTKLTAEMPKVQDLDERAVLHIDIKQEQLDF